MNSKPILIIGGDSFIGKGLVKLLTVKHVSFYATSRKLHSKWLYFDLSDKDSWLEVTALIEKQYFSCVVLLAGITTNKLCNDDKVLSNKVNVQNTCILLSALHQSKTFSLFISSSQVFSHQRPHIKWTEPYNPSSLYGMQKSEVETYIISNKLDCAIVRLTKVLSEDFSLFSNIIQDAKLNKNISLFNDYYAAPISLSYVNYLILNIIKYKKLGVYQLSGEEDLSYVDMAKKILKYKGLSGSVISISSLEKGVLPVRYGSLEPYSSADFVIESESFEHILTTMFA